MELQTNKHILYQWSLFEKCCFVQRNAKSNDAKSKAKAKTYTDKKKRAKLHDWKVGDIVYAKLRRTSKFMTYFSEKELKITDIKFSMISVRDPVSRKEFTSDISHFIKKKKEDLG